MYEGRDGMELDFIDVSRDAGSRRVRSSSNVGQESNNVRRPNARYAPEGQRASGTTRRPVNEIEGGRKSRPGTGNSSNVRKQQSAKNTSGRRREQEAKGSPDRRRSAGYDERIDRNIRHRARPADSEVAQEKMRRRKARRKKRVMARLTAMTVLLLAVVLLVLGLVYMAARIFTSEKEKDRILPVTYVPEKPGKEESSNGMLKPAIEQNFLTVNEYSRPGEALNEVNNIFVHYTANKGTSAAQNRSYFENLGTTGETSASAHFIIGYEGEIIQCIPLNEIAYAVQRRNYDSVSIECCYQQDDGKFTDATYQSLIHLCAWLLEEYHLEPEDMRRHYDEGGKKCPLYFVEHPEAWEQFLRDLREYIEAAGGNSPGGTV